MTRVSQSQRRLRRTVARLLVIQVVVTLAVATGFYLLASVPMGVWSVLYGGVMAMIASSLLAWRVIRASRPGAGTAGLYLSMFERMAFVVVGFVLALAVLELAPLALIAGFFGAQVAYYLTAGSVLRQTSA